MSFFSWFMNFLYSQFFVTPPKPTQSFSGQTIIVTGSNTGLGLEAAHHITRLGAQKVILAVRNTSKGEAAKKAIEAATGRDGVVDVWSLDLSSYESVKQFVARAMKELTRVDVLLENAGMMISKFQLTEEDETTVTVNVTSTFLLALLMLPKLKETATKFNVVPRLTIVSSDLHFVTKFSERNASKIFDALNDKTKTNMGDRYGVTKLLEIFLVRHLQSLLASTPTAKAPVIVNCLTPGACASDFFREEVNLPMRIAMGLAQSLIARTAEVGGRTLVAAAAGGEETAGQYMADGIVSHASPYVLSEEGKKMEDKVWGELIEKLERIQPGISKNV